MVAVMRKFNRLGTTPYDNSSQRWARRRPFFRRSGFRDAYASLQGLAPALRRTLILALAPPRGCKSEKYQRGPIETHDVLVIEATDTRTEP